MDEARGSHLIIIIIIISIICRERVMIRD